MAVHGVWLVIGNALSLQSGSILVKFKLKDFKKVKTKQPVNESPPESPPFYLKMLYFLNKHVAEILGEERYTEHLMTNLHRTKVFQ